MNRTEAVEWLSRLVSADTPPTLTQEDTQRALDQSRVVDPDGRAPVDDGYVETLNVDYAAACLFDLKATLSAAQKVDRVTSWSSEGSSVSRESGATAGDFRALADEYRDKAFPSGGVSVIDLGPAVSTATRSAFPGVTPDDAHRA